MYFKKLIENFGPIQKYFVDDLMALSDQFEFTYSRRNIIGFTNTLMAGSVMKTELVSNINFLLSYITSQNFDILKDKVIYEKTICKPGVKVDGYDFSVNRYVNRVGETIFVPIRGSAEIRSVEFPNEATKLEIGNLYRINTRCLAQFETDDDFLVVAYTFVDYDMYKYLMPHDFHGPFPRRTDEVFNYEPGKIEKEVDRSAY